MKRIFIANARSVLIGSLWLVLCPAFSPLMAEDDPTQDEMYKNGLLPTSTYSGPQTVNMYNGNFIVSVPVLSLPGRAGHDLNLALTYNSKQLTRYLNGSSQWVARWFHEGPTVGRWIINTWPSLQFEGDLDAYFTTPDGAVHRLERENTGEYWYYSKDGSYLRYHVNNETVSYVNGISYDFSDFDSLLKVYNRDRHGNTITYEFEDNGSGATRPFRITDTLGREVTLSYNTNPSKWTLLESITVKNHAGVDLVYSLEVENKPLLPTAWMWTGFQNIRYYDCELTETANNVDLLSKITLPNGNTWEFTYNLDIIDQGWGSWENSTTGTMTSMKMPTGATVDYSFHTTSWARLSKFVKDIDVDPLGGGAFTTSYGYNYSGGANLGGTETRADGSKHIVDFSPSTSSLPFLRELETWTDKDGTTDLIESATSWSATDYGSSPTNVTVTDLVSGVVQMTATATDEFGRVVHNKLYESGYLNRATYNRWNTDLLSTWRSQLLQVEEAVGHFSERVVGLTEYDYDEFSLTDRGTVLQQASGYGPGNNTRGNLTTVSRYLTDEARWVESHSYYDTVGNVVQVKDALNNSTTVDYSSTFHYAYPTQVTNPLAHYTQANYNFNTGLVTSRTDANGQVTTQTYETYNRPSKESWPGGGSRLILYKDHYFSGKYRTYTLTYMRHTAGVSERKTWQYFDGLGRLLRTRDRTFASSLHTYVDRVYEICSCTGKTEKVSLPYISGDPIYWTETEYDGIGRPTKVIPPDGSPTSNYTEYKYSGVTINNITYPIRAVFDAKGVGKAYVTDAAGQLVEVREDPNYTTLASSTVTDYDQHPGTSYSYKSVLRWDIYTQSYQSKLVYMADHNYSEIYQGVQTRTFQYDSLGRPAEETHPENGTTTYAYNDNGWMLSKTDARGVVTAPLYDALGRPTSIGYSDSTPTATYTYDTGGYGIGRLYETSNANATTTYLYNLRGFVVGIDKTIGTEDFSISYTRNYVGAAKSTMLPNGTTISYTRNRGHKITGVTSDWVDANHPATLATSFVYSGVGALLTSVEYGNGTVSTRSFNTGMQLKTLEYGTLADPDQYLDFEYDYDEGVSNTGQIMKITDHIDTTKTINYEVLPKNWTGG